MCGGIVGLFGAGLQSAEKKTFLSRPPFWIAYNSGRIASYVVAGAIVGYLGGRALSLFDPVRAHNLGLMFAGSFMIALGLNISGWWQGLRWLERGGSVVWRRIEPVGRRILQSSSQLRALGLGAVWGWLPCGLVYSVLAWSLTVGSAAGGALLMLAFGLGTLPMLLTMGAATDNLLRWPQQPSRTPARRRGRDPVRRIDLPRHRPPSPHRCRHRPDLVCATFLSLCRGPVDIRC